MIGGPKPDGATSLDRNECDGLIPSLTTRDELAEYEAAGIGRARLWALKNRTLRKSFLTVDGMLLLHREMFSGVWNWAGKLRLSEKNIGRPPEQIPMDLTNLMDDVAFQIANGTYPWPELAVRFHHRLVYIHPFPNGNGRHARLAEELMLRFNRQPPLSWGRRLRDPRAEYLRALKEADRGNYESLFKLASS